MFFLYKNPSTYKTEILKYVGSCVIRFSHFPFFIDAWVLLLKLLAIFILINSKIGKITYDKKKDN